jgi:hypothetical protein
MVLSASPAIDPAPRSEFVVFDQRGISRPQGVGADLGVFERRKSSLSLGLQWERFVPPDGVLRVVGNPSARVPLFAASELSDPWTLTADAVATGEGGGGVYLHLLPQPPLRWWSALFSLCFPLTLPCRNRNRQCTTGSASWLVVTFFERLAQGKAERTTMSGNLVLGAVAGAVVGFGYSKLVGCPTGACPLTRNPWFAAVYGGFVGALMSGVSR